MAKLKDFAISDARPFPVILLVDVSGSMKTNGKMDAVNEAGNMMLQSFSAEDQTRAVIHVGVITFGGAGARVVQKPTSAVGLEWPRLTAAGKTPLGEALDLATGMIEDRQTIKSRAYKPTLVLISDGQPTDDWEGALSRLQVSERASKAVRYAMAIGDDADIDELRKFVTNPNGRVFRAHEARQIKQFFQWVTLSITIRSRSLNPDKDVIEEPTDFDDFDF